jgi:hypothetical protein
MAVTEKKFWYEGIEEGKKRERERIIKLIEDHYKMTHDRLLNGKNLITIIKEEEKTNNS